MKTRIMIAIITGLAVAALLLGARLMTQPAHGHQAVSATGSASATGRLVMVSRSLATVSQPGQPLHVKLLSGASFSQQPGVVLTDENCQPDLAGVSHCLNTIQLSSGQAITIRHLHRMSDVPCLTPGEHVTVRMSTA